MPHRHRRTKGLFARGYEACVTSPPAACADGTPLPTGAIGKVLVSPLVDAEEEVEANRVLVTKLDPRNRFSLPMLTACATSVREVRRVTGGRCTQAGMPLRWPSTRLTQLVYPYGGPDLGEAMHRVAASHASAVRQWSQVLRLVYEFGNVMRGVADLVRHGYCHLDLKAPNVLCGGAGTGNARMVLHDWSWLTPFDRIFDVGCRWCILRRIKSAAFRGRFLDHHAPEMHAFQSPRFLRRATREGKFSTSLVRDPVARAQYVRFAARLDEQLSTGERKAVFASFAPKLDVYSCGYVLLQLLQTPDAPCPARLQAAAAAAARLSAVMYDQNPYTRASIRQALVAHRSFCGLFSKLQ